MSQRVTYRWKCLLPYKVSVFHWFPGHFIHSPTPHNLQLTSVAFYLSTASLTPDSDFTPPICQCHYFLENRCNWNHLSDPFKAPFFFLISTNTSQKHKKSIFFFSQINKEKKKSNNFNLHILHFYLSLEFRLMLKSLIEIILDFKCLKEERKKEMLTGYKPVVSQGASLLVRHILRR